MRATFFMALFHNFIRGGFPNLGASMADAFHHDFMTTASECCEPAPASRSIAEPILAGALCVLLIVGFVGAVATAAALSLPFPSPSIFAFRRIAANREVIRAHCNQTGG
jgi:hypothetical protein